MRLGSDLPTETGKEGCYLPRYLAFKGMAPRSSEKDILGPRADRWPISFAEGFIYISEGESESEVTQSCLTLCDPMDCSHQAPPSMEYSRQEYWNGLPFLYPGDLPNPGIEPRSPALQADAFTI